MKLNNIATFLAVAGLSLIVITTLLLFFVPVTDKNLQTLDLILGNALGWVSSAFAFFFGSSTGNKAKDETISSLAATIGTSPTPPTTPPLSTETKAP